MTLLASQPMTDKTTLARDIAAARFIEIPRGCQPRTPPESVTRLRRLIDRSTFSKRSISGTAPNYRYIKARSNEGNLYILRFDEHHPAWELIMFKSVRKDRA
jgi:hypothetical protein